MAKNKEVAELLGEEAATQNSNFLPAEINSKLSALDFLAEKPNSEMIELTGGEWLSMNEGDIHNLLAVGFEEKEGNRGPQKAAVLLDREGNKKYASQHVLVSSLEKLGEDTLAAGVPVRIIVGPKVQSKDGNSYQSMKVYRL